MTSINSPPDDMSVRNLRLKNANTPAITPATATSPAIDTLETKTGITLPAPANKQKQRRKEDRRKKSRRNNKASVILDTRSNHDRRRQDRRQNDINKNRYGSRLADDDDTINENRGIDEIV